MFIIEFMMECVMLGIKATLGYAIVFWAVVLALKLFAKTQKWMDKTSFTNEKD